MKQPLGSPPLPRLSEEQEMRLADKAATLLGFRIVNFSQSRASKQTPGIPDRKYYHVGRHETFWWEAKAENGRLSPAQRDFAEMAAACNEHVIIGTSENAIAYMHRLTLGAR